jgi:hypothetical protein
LIPSLTEGDSLLNFASDPFLAPDGQLYFFYATLPYTQQEDVSRVPLQLVRSAADGVTDRTVLRPETYENLNEALWAPDASFVVAVIAPAPDVYQGGAVQLVYSDVTRGMIPLLPFAMKIKWGP